MMQNETLIAVLKMTIDGTWALIKLDNSDTVIKTFIPKES